MKRRRMATLVGALRTYHRAAPVVAWLRLLVAVVTGLVPVAVAWLTKLLLDGLARPGGAPARLGLVALALAVVGAVGALLQHLGRYLDQEVGRKVGLHTQAELFAAVVRAPGLTELEDPTFHDRVQLARQSSQSGPVLLTGSLLTIAQATFTLGGFLASLLALSPLAALLVTASMGPTLAAQLRLSRMRTATTTGNSPRQRRQMFYAALLLDLRAAKEIRLFGLGRYFRDRMLVEIGEQQRGERRVDLATARTDALLSLLTAAVSAVVLVVTVARLATGQGHVGDLAVLIAALGAVQAAVAGLVTQIATADSALALFEHYLAVVPAGRVPLAAGAAVPSLRQGIRFEDVWFRYGVDQPWVLQGVHLHFRQGQSTALVGLNGAGKSTIVKLLCRFYEPVRGRITWDGVDLADLDIAALRARIATVFQDFVCYELSARDNIALGALGDGDVTAAAVRAGMHETLAALPDGYDTMLTRTFADGERRRRHRSGESQSGDSSTRRGGQQSGVVLSGGQWQRVALARALIRTDADLLILDEPSSGLDARAEAEVHRTLRELRTGRTSLLISHRLNTLRGADHIVVLRDGRIAEEGDHDALMHADGTYAELFRLQAEGFADVATTTDGGNA
ncbi:ABC transporter ATP-binding protein [Dactylosporangium sp. CA-139066]|uniref:ABC transporter ATP-binding protein n=1 Tax=Dactylosporangium sp. CA-139066 TaxID=3239930 RepID=UPI003D93B4A9